MTAFDTLSVRKLIAFEGMANILSDNLCVWGRERRWALRVENEVVARSGMGKSHSTGV
jgi:hypothetical protein